jgi:hypothetical protein
MWQVLLFSWANLLFPTETVVTYQTWEGSWNSGHVAWHALCAALGLGSSVPKSPFVHNGAGQDTCRSLELKLREVHYGRWAALLVIVGCGAVVARRSRSEYQLLNWVKG